MNDLVMIIKHTVVPNFLNIRTSIKAYDRDALCCGAPCWRWVYHALHSADKWFINPNDYEEPAFHEEGMDNPDNPTSVVLSDEQLHECPENCRFTRMELVLRQYRHLSFHTGMLNGQVAVNTGKFPMWVSDADKYIDDGVFFGRYRSGQTKI